VGTVPLTVFDYGATVEEVFLRRDIAYHVGMTCVDAGVEDGDVRFPILDIVPCARKVGRFESPLAGSFLGSTARSPNFGSFGTQEAVRM